MTQNDPQNDPRVLEALIFELLLEMCNEPNPVIRCNGKIDKHGFPIFERISSVHDQPKGTA